MVEDPRVLASGVTDADLVGQYQHNMRVLKLVNDTNLAVARVTQAQAGQNDAAKAAALKAIADKLITPRVRYSPPGLQTHVSYLYSETNATDQKVGGDAIERYADLRKRIDAITAQLDKLVGPVNLAQLAPYMNAGFDLWTSGDDETEEDDDDDT